MKLNGVTKLLKPTTKRGEQFISFAECLLQHIEQYTVPQYGDAPNDLVEDWSVDDCLRQIQKYTKRQGKNARKDQDGQDLMKIAHYAQLAWSKHV